MTPSALQLRAGELRLALRPDLGGSIAGLWLGELPVMRSTEPAELASSRLAACYPLVPYSNRLGYRRLRWHGHDYTTAPNEAGSPHSLHGVAWQRGWEVLEAGDAGATLRLVHPGDSHWPFAFEVTQRFVLQPDALEITLALRNTGTEPQPAGLGWHPYFPKRARSRLHAEVEARWDSDSSGLPTRAVPQPGIDADVAHLSFDHCFDGWRGQARIRDEKLSLRLTSSMSRLVVYTPPTKPYFCVEPVSHVSNAVHMADPLANGLVDVAPGAGTEAWMRLDIAAV